MKGRTKAGILLQYSQEMLSETELDILVKKDFKRESRNLLKKESIRVLEWNMRSGYNQDDFVHDRISVVFTGFSYKVPKIVKKMLLK